MTVEEKVWRRRGARDWWKSSRLGEYLNSIVTSRWGITLLLVVATLLIYYITSFRYDGHPISLKDSILDGPSPAPHNHPVRLADSFLHGRLDVANGKDLLGFLDFACQPYPCAEGSKYYPLEPPGTALVILPGVLLFGLSINQTLVSLVIGALTAGVVFQVSRRLTENIREQIWLTVMLSFGTVYWWNAVYGGVWYFNHAVAVLFLFAAVYETLVGKRPFTSGILLGAAYITRLPTVWGFLFFFIMFTEWGKLRQALGGLRHALGGLRWAQLRASVRDLLKVATPLLKFSVGLGIFVVGFAVLNIIRFDTPSPEATLDHWHAKQQLSVPGGMLEHGLVSVKHIDRHAPIFFEKPLYMFPNSPDWKFWQADAPYVLPSWNGAAFWATTPAFLFAFLAAIKKRWMRLVGGALLAFTVIFFFIIPNLGRGPSSYPWFDWAQWDVPRLVRLAPFFILAALSIIFAIQTRNKLVVACWAAVIPVVIVHHLAASTGWPQFGYRYLLDYAPFAFLLTWEGMGRRLTWQGMALIAAGVIINLGGVLWTNKFDTNSLGGIHWTSW
ncbi:MAG TPA: hypothetical protein VJX16_29215 [Terriglobales bacterium]|nr:hypothetical protein [Terriglobales bacterium]